MAVLQIQAAPFFASKNRAFWNLQLAGWGAAFLLRAVSALANQQPFDILALILVTTITGFSISLILSVIYRKLIHQTPLVTWGLTAVVLFFAVLLHASIDAWVQGVYYAASRETTFAQRLIGLLYLPLTLLGGWSALYYAINFFLTVEQQADRLERLVDQFEALDAIVEQAAQHPDKAEATLREHLGKLGTTILSALEVQLNLGQPWFVPASVINALRRDAVAALEAARVAGLPRLAHLRQGYMEQGNEKLLEGIRFELEALQKQAQALQALQDLRRRRTGQGRA